MKWIAFLGLLLAFYSAPANDIRGAWSMQNSDGEYVTMIVNDDYLVLALYDLPGKKFGYTEGGTYTLQGNTLTYNCEFNSEDSSKVGEKTSWQVALTANSLALTGNRGSFRFDRVDKASDHAMSGTWHITGRAQDGKGDLVRIHQTGTRKTLKILSGTRFQWVAIDPGVKGFFGTGGGTYVAKDGKYTEKIEFFSRDNSRVGASLDFGWKLEDGRWDHSGKSSKGDPIHEIWEKVNKKATFGTK